MIGMTRTDQLRAAIEAELEEQRPALDAGVPMTSITMFIDLHPDGNVRRVKFRTDREREMRGDERREVAERSRRVRA
jgi:hypothetical protein